MEENAQKFLEKMNELVALGKKKKSILDVQEIKGSASPQASAKSPPAGRAYIRPTMPDKL